MAEMISLPREALAELLRASGSLLSPEEYLSSLMMANPNRKYPSRVTASLWSKYFLITAAVISTAWLVFDFGVESILVAIILTVITFFEYRVNRYFREGNAEAPHLGFCNQSAFAAFILVYGLYHAYAAQLSPMMREYNNLLDADTMSTIRAMTQITYLTIGIVGGLSQFGLAWYYRSARVTEDLVITSSL